MPSTIYCTVVEAKPTSEPNGASPEAARDLLPWADPYIARLVRKHQLALGRLDAEVVCRLEPYTFDDLDEQDLAAEMLATVSDSPYEWDAYRFSGRSRF